MSFTELQHHALRSENRPSALGDSCCGCHDVTGRETDFGFQNLRRNLISHGQHDGALKRERDRSSVLGKQKGISCSYCFGGGKVTHMT